jgi:hypothetical protein
MAQTPKMVKRSVAIAFAILCIITLVGLNFSLFTYFSETQSRNEQIQTLNSQLDAVQAQIENITSPTPNLISVGMEYKDNRTNLNAPFLQVTGYVVNVGTGRANNCAVHVSAIQNGNSTAIDESATIDPIEPGTSQRINLQIAYTGEPIVAYSANLEWEG